jgi:hypothetical protein
MNLGLDTFRFCEIVVDYLIKQRLEIFTDLFQAQEDEFYKFISEKYFDNVDSTNITRVWAFWIQDIDDVQVKVEKMIKKIHELFKFRDSELCFLIMVEPERWEKFLMEDTIGKKRKRFNCSFRDYLSRSLQKKGIPCWLDQSWNWFSIAKKATKYWSGVSHCIKDICNVKFEFDIKENPSNGNEILTFIPF